MKMMQKNIERPSIIVSLIALFAALYVVLSLLPGIPVIGLPEMKIELEASIASVFGIVLGPYLGTLAAFIGTIAAFFLPPGFSLFSAIFIFNPALNALIVGLIFKNKWKIAFVLFAIIIIAFWLTPISNPINENWYVALVSTFDKIIALLLIIPVAIMLRNRSIQVEKIELKLLSESFLLVFLISFIGNQADSALGCLIFALPPVYEGIWGLNLEVTRGLFLISPLAYPTIRLIQAFIAALIGLPLIKVFRILRVQV
jgi:hypothetical protein